MSELHHGLVAVDMKPLMNPLTVTGSGWFGGLAGWYMHNIRREEMRVAMACTDRRAGHLAIYARKNRQRRKNWKRVVRATVEEIREAFNTRWGPIP